AVRVGTRGSRLALWQAEHVVAALRARHPGLAFRTVVVRTTGDRLQEATSVRALSVGIFTRELEQALRDARVDLVVHSLKDLPVDPPPGLVLAAILEREDPREALVGP